MWVSWGINKIDTKLVKVLLTAKEAQARAAAVRAIQYNVEAFPNKTELLLKAAADNHWLVRHEAVVASSWLGAEIATAVINEAEKKPVLIASKDAYRYGRAHGTNQDAKPEVRVIVEVPSGLPKKFHASYRRGAELYLHLENCASCHGQKGEGIQNVMPPLAGSEWVNWNKEMLAQIVISGVSGEMKVKGKVFNGFMPSFAHRIPNKDIAKEVKEMDILKKKSQIY